MLGRNYITLTLLVLWGHSLGIAVGSAQTVETWYRIKGGTYLVTGGLWGELTRTLPSADQTFVRLEIEPANGTARMTILDAQRQLVFNTLINGLVAGGDIRFSYDTDGPWPQQDVRCQVDYTATFDANALAFAGSRAAAAPICCDIPYAFVHSNVVATACRVLRAIPAPTNQGLMTLTWDGAPGVRLQRAASLPAPGWEDVPGSAGTNTITLPISSNLEFYRLAGP